MTQEATPADSKAPSRLRTVLPWLVAAGALFWLVKMVPFADLRDAVARVPKVPLAILVVVCVVGTLITDSFAIWATFRHALADVRLSYRETLIVRGASYLLAIVHYGAGQGGLAYFVHRRHGVELSRAAGAVMLIMGVNVVVVALCAFAGTLAGGGPAADSAPFLRWMVIALACGFPGYLAVIAAKPKFLAKRKLLAPLFAAGLKGHFFAALARLPHMAWLIVASFLGMRMFGVNPPFLTAVTLLPIVFAVAVLPISPSGLGTTQAMAVALFAPYAVGVTVEEQRAAVLAYSLAFQFSSLIVQLPLGMVFLRAATRAGIVAKRDGAATGS